MKANDFYIGVVLLFSVMLPGIVMTLLILRAGWFDPFLKGLVPDDPAIRIGALLLAAYGFGHLVFMLGSTLDWLIYDRIREWIWPNDQDGAYRIAEGLCRTDLGIGPNDPLPMPTYAWAKSRFLMDWSEADRDVRRFEADSKFFRSMVPVLLFAALQFVFEAWMATSIATAALSIMAFARYVEQRHKSTEWAYRHAILLSRHGAISTRNLGDDG